MCLLTAGRRGRFYLGQEDVIPKASFQAQKRFERLARDGAKLGGNRRCDYCELVEVWSLLLRRRQRPTEVRRGESGEVQSSATLPSAELCFSALLKVSANSSTLQRADSSAAVARIIQMWRERKRTRDRKIPAWFQKLLFPP